MITNEIKKDVLEDIGFKFHGDEPGQKYNSAYCATPKVVSINKASCILCSFYKNAPFSVYQFMCH